MNRHNRHTIVLLDNLDSFTYNLVDEFYKMDYDVRVYRNTLPATYICEQMDALSGSVLLVLSPGPGVPSGAGCMPEMIKKTAGRYPILGICLGHQALVEHYGGTVVPAPEVMHGKSSLITHDGQRMFANLPNPMAVGRYHSLVAGTVRGGLTVTAHYQDIPMAVWHEQEAVFGMQFHPESLLTTYGARLLQQSICYMEKHVYAHPAR